jgi:hypothetical protein
MLSKFQGGITIQYKPDTDTLIASRNKGPEVAVL